MASGDALASAEAVAKFASRLFDAPIGPDGVIVESLQRATNPALTLENIDPLLGASVDEAISHHLDDAALCQHPLAVWIELEIGLRDGQALERRPPVQLAEAAERLSSRTGHDVEVCRIDLNKCYLS